MERTKMMKFFTIIGIFSLFPILHLVNFISAAVGLSSSAPSPIGLFSVVQFPNDACTASSGLTGTCVTSTECTSRSGVSEGGCAAGFGVCCVVSSATCLSSGTTISQNNTYVRSEILLIVNVYLCIPKNEYNFPMLDLIFF